MMGTIAVNAVEQIARVESTWPRWEALAFADGGEWLASTSGRAFEHATSFDGGAVA
jgi:hypothetical protein